MKMTEVKLSTYPFQIIIQIQSLSRVIICVDIHNTPVMFLINHTTDIGDAIVNPWHYFHTV